MVRSNEIEDDTESTESETTSKQRFLLRDEANIINLRFNIEKKSSSVLF